MSDQQIREALEKQFQLLSERSQVCYDDRELVSLTEAMVGITSLLLRL